MVAKPGDYIKYDSGTNYTGLWQVLYNDASNGLQIISVDIVEDITLGSDTEEDKAKADYNDAVDILNTASRKYVNPIYATSGRCVGSNPTSPDDAITDTVTLQFEYNGDTESGVKVEEENFNNDYDAMMKATNHSKDGINNIDKAYWLASRQVNSYDNHANFLIRHVNSSGIATGGSLYHIYSTNDLKLNSGEMGLRPVITLKTGIQTYSSTGSAQDAYKLIIK